MQKMLLVVSLSISFMTLNFGLMEKAQAVSAEKQEPTKPSTFKALKANLSRKIKGLDKNALDAGLKAYLCATNVHNTAPKKYLTIVDYSKPSSQKRMFIIDMQRGKLISSQLVAHGQNTGGRLATKFSNKDGSHQSSLGVFMTGREYHGKHGLSLRLQGLERDYNDKAGRRAIVMHGANYVNPSYVRKYGMVGRSWGCMAIDNKATQSTIQTLKQGSVVVAYYNDNDWLNSSSFLHCKAAV